MNTKQSVWVDFKLIKERITIPDLLNHYGIKLKTKRDGSLVGICPLHDGADNPSAFVVSPDGHAWKCFTKCNAGGNVIDFVMRKESVDLRKAGEILTETFLPGIQSEQDKPGNLSPEKQSNHSVRPLNKPIDLDLSKMLKADIPFLTEEKKLKRSVIKKFGLGLVQKGMHAGRVVIPIHNPQGELVAYAGRSLDKQDIAQGNKYFFPPGFHKNAELFNIHRIINIQKLIDKRGIVLVEGFFDVISLWQNGIYNAVALMGTYLSEWQKEMLLNHTNKIILMLDKDDAGKTATKKIANSLVPHCYLLIPSFPTGIIQPEELTKEDLKSLLDL